MIVTYLCSILLLIIAYLLGSIPNAVWIGKKYYGVDVREHGSKNAGSTNVLRVLGRRAALPVFALDIFKGFVAVTLIRLLGYLPDVSIAWIDSLSIVAVFVVILGHIFPIFADFKGGKGVATLVGAVIGINPPIVLLCLGVWFVVFVLSHYVSLSSMIAGVCLPIFTLISPTARESMPFVIFTIVIAVLLIWTHRKNIERLRDGSESKIYILKKKNITPKE
ncbi:MAG: glycerol-3-phosphate 1-O-acyltransferase PlsY [Rikenellaceae bacterium]